jgi:hypothetical protein
MEENDAGLAASDVEEDADMEAWADADAEAEAREAAGADVDAWAEAGADAEAWGEAEADVDAVVWGVDQEPGPVAWEAEETAGGAVPVPEAAEPRPATGEPRVDAALARLDELAGRPVTEHRAVFEDVHRRLRDVLGELDSREQDQVPAGGAERRAGR